jgi:uncharacterized membrane protein
MVYPQVCLLPNIPKKVKGETMSNQSNPPTKSNPPTNQSYRENASFFDSRDRAYRHDPSIQNDINLALALGTLAVAGGITYWLLRRGKQHGVATPGSGIRARNSITIMKSPELLYSFWRKLENLPRVMQHLESVQETDGTHSHWVSKALLGTSVAWDAEITEDKPNERIAWRSLEGSQIPNEGFVEFISADEGQGTVVHVNLTYQPPGGQLGAAVARLFGEEPNRQIEEDMWRFQQIMELEPPPYKEQKLAEPQHLS